MVNFLNIIVKFLKVIKHNFLLYLDRIIRVLFKNGKFTFIEIMNLDSNRMLIYEVSIIILTNKVFMKLKI